LKGVFLMIVCLGATPTLQRTMTFAHVRVGVVNRATAVHEFASGKSINAARVVRTLDEPVIATGLLGGDRGHMIRSDLDCAGIRNDFVPVEPRTRLCTTLLDASKGTATELIEEPQPVPREAYGQLLNRLGELLNQANGLVLSGSLTPGAPESFYAQCVELAAGRVPLVLDATGPALDFALEQGPLVVKPNRIELAQTLDAEVDDEESMRGAMRQMAARGAQWVVVTCGEEPTLLTEGRGFWRVHTPTASVVNPIGSGDAFAAGLTMELARGRDVPEACELAVACAVANAMTPHAGHVRPAGVAALKDRIRVVKV
jgi:tagatose 6-phosphate kinase